MYVSHIKLPAALRQWRVITRRCNGIIFIPHRGKHLNHCTFVSTNVCACVYALAYLLLRIKYPYQFICKKSTYNQRRAYGRSYVCIVCMTICICMYICMHVLYYNNWTIILVDLANTPLPYYIHNINIHMAQPVYVNRCVFVCVYVK